MADNSKPKEHDAILKDQLKMGFREYRRSNISLFLSAISAGLELGFSVLLMGILYTLFQPEVSASSLTLIVALGYPIGFVFVIIGRSELFTEETSLAMIPVLNGKVPLQELFRVWGTVITGNLLGGALIGLLITWIGIEHEIITAETFYHLGTTAVKGTSAVIFGSAVLAGWMMGLLGWLHSAVQDAMSRIVVVVVVTMIIGLADLHHCILGSAKVMMAWFSGGPIPASEYLQFMAFSVAGNISGGAFFVAMLKYGQFATSQKDRK